MTRASVVPRSRSSLLTVDEARTAVVRSAARCLDAATCAPEGMVAILMTFPSGPGWTERDASLAREHRKVLEQVVDSGHAQVIAEELQGILSATGLEDGELRDLEVVRAQAERSTQV